MPHRQNLKGGLRHACAKCRLHGVLVSHLTSSPYENGGGEGEAMVAGGEGYVGASPMMPYRRCDPGGVDPMVSCWRGASATVRSSYNLASTHLW